MIYLHHPLLAALLSAFVVSLVSLGAIILLPLGEERLQAVAFLLISLATGALFGDSVFHLLPEIFQDPVHRLRGSLWVLAGICSSFIFEKFLRWKYEHGLDHVHGVKPVGRILLVSDGLHNFVDGMLIGASYLASFQVGLATTLAVVLHELPHEIGDFGVLIHAGWSRSRALLLNFISAGVAILGVFAAFGFQAGLKSFSDIALAVTAGSFIYIAGSNLTPELQKENAPVKSLLQILMMLIGVGSMSLLLLIE